LRKWLATVGVVAAGAVVGLQAMRLGDVRQAEAAWRRLETQSADAGRFDLAMVADLPEPARRYFRFAIAPGARLAPAVEIEMDGELSLGTKAEPNFMPMQARQVLAGERGFVWLLEAGSGAMRMSGSDGYEGGVGWTRFWLLNIAPVARVSGGGDVARSAAGRAIAEAVFWAPQTLLPRQEVRWEPVDADTARARVSHAGHEHVLEVKVSEDGRPRSVLIQRWSRENSERKWRLQPFGGEIKGFVEVEGYRLASEVEGGNWFGTDDYFPFYKARVTRIALAPTKGSEKSQR
jgi:hypothetical protein